MVELRRVGRLMSSLAILATLTQYAAGCSARVTALNITSASLATSAAGAPAACLPGERGYLGVALRGVLDERLEWRGATLRCEGSSRPAGTGLRVSFSGPRDARGQALRIVFGFPAHPGAALLHNQAANVTILVEGQGRLWATQGDGKCQADSLVQQPIPAGAAPAGTPGEAHAYRIAARGYCIDPASNLDGSEPLYIDRFDFAGIAVFEDNDLQDERHTTHAAN
jgi:hypothetical protein